MTNPKTSITSRKGIKLQRFFPGLLLCLAFAASAADFTLQDMQGKTQRLSDYRGKWVLVNLWATWCPPCRNEIPELNRLARAHQDLVVIGIAMEYREAKTVADFVKKYDVAYPVVLGDRKMLTQIGELEVLPTSYLYDPSGKQVSYQAGEVTQQSVEAYIKRHR